MNHSSPWKSAKLNHNIIVTHVAKILKNIYIPTHITHKTHAYDAQTRQFHQVLKWYEKGHLLDLKQTFLGACQSGLRNVAWQSASDNVNHQYQQSQTMFTLGKKKVAMYRYMKLQVQCVYTQAKGGRGTKTAKVGEVLGWVKCTQEELLIILCHWVGVP